MLLLDARESAFASKLMQDIWNCLLRQEEMLANCRRCFRFQPGRIQR